MHVYMVIMCLPSRYVCDICVYTRVRGQEARFPMCYFGLGVLYPIDLNPAPSNHPYPDQPVTPIPKPTTRALLNLSQTQTLSQTYTRPGPGIRRPEDRPDLSPGQASMAERSESHPVNQTAVHVIFFSFIEHSTYSFFYHLIHKCCLYICVLYSEIHIYRVSVYTVRAQCIYITMY